MTIEQRFVADLLDVRSDGDATFITGYAAVFNRLSKNLGGFVERIAPGAFKRVLNSGSEVQAWFNHDPNTLLGSTASGTLDLREDDTGLRYEFRIDRTDSDHERVLSKVRRGDLKGSSFGFRVASDEWGTTEEDFPQRTVIEVAELRDVGPVSVPAYPDTAVALRSLAVLVDRPVDALVEAAARNELRDFLIRTVSDDPTDDSEGLGDTLPDLSAARVRQLWIADHEDFGRNPLLETLTTIKGEHR